MFHHWEYIGDDFEADMAALDHDPLIKYWWSYCEPCQDPFHWDGAGAVWINENSIFGEFRGMPTANAES